ncbi:MAG TPA: YerC/YecD family TrpR-related protein [Erysipelothrix sp.]|nr:YerC/YecD family TrpR-related protein [Erysipelothrix sp.]
MEHKALYEAILKLETIEECHNFFEDIATKKELNDFSDRLNVATLLLEGKTYDTINKETLISSATIARVNRALTYGTGGYKHIINKQKED